MEKSFLDFRLPRDFSEILKKFGVFVVEWFPCFVLGCEKCGCVWVPKYTPTGRLARSFWQCPMGCGHTHDE